MARLPSAARRGVIAYAEAHAEEASYLSARELGRRCGASESTVIRAVQERGYPGFPAFQEELRAAVVRRRTTVERLTARGEADPLARAFARDIDNLRDTWDRLSPQAFERAAVLLAGGARTWLLGLRTPHAVAVLLREGLSYLGIDARLLVPGTGDIWDGVDRVQPGDVVVAVTFPRYTRAVVEAAALARRRGARLIALTDGPASPLAAEAEVLLPAAYGLDGYIESFTACACLAQALLLEVSRRMGPRAREALEEKETLWAERGVYWE
ncbi:MAG: MurR/RpiR family transcriptional regulator [Thermodesulfobacteriota bacterium]